MQPTKGRLKQKYNYFFSTKPAKNPPVRYFLDKSLRRFFSLTGWDTIFWRLTDVIQLIFSSCGFRKSSPIAWQIVACAVQLLHNRIPSSYWAKPSTGCKLTMDIISWRTSDKFLTGSSQSREEYFLGNLLITFLLHPADFGLVLIHHSVWGGKNDRINLDFLSVGYLKCTKADQSFHFYFWFL